MADSAYAVSMNESEDRQTQDVEVNNKPGGTELATGTKHELGDTETSTVQSRLSSEPSPTQHVASSSPPTNLSEKAVLFIAPAADQISETSKGGQSTLKSALQHGDASSQEADAEAEISEAQPKRKKAKKATSIPRKRAKAPSKQRRIDAQRSVAKKVLSPLLASKVEQLKRFTKTPEPSRLLLAPNKDNWIYVTEYDLTAALKIMSVDYEMGDPSNIASFEVEELIVKRFQGPLLAEVIELCVLDTTIASDFERKIRDKISNHWTGGASLLCMELEMLLRKRENLCQWRSLDGDHEVWNEHLIDPSAALNETLAVQERRRTLRVETWEKVLAKDAERMRKLQDSLQLRVFREAGGEWGRNGVCPAPVIVV